MIDLKILRDIPPWEWPRDTARRLHRDLTDSRTTPSDRLIAAELAGDFTVINDELAEDLLAIVNDGAEAEELRATAAIAFGAALETADIEQFENPDDVPISERMFHKIQDSLRKLYSDHSLPKLVRRRILEASVRSPQDWHKNAIQTAWPSDDLKWKLTAVFCMRYVRGFDGQIMEALNSANPEIQQQAVEAAGAWEVVAAWPHVVELVGSPNTPKDLLIAAIEAVGSIRPGEAEEVLAELTDSEDEDVADAASEAMEMARGALGIDEEEEDEDEEDGLVN